MRKGWARELVERVLVDTGLKKKKMKKGWVRELVESELAEKGFKKKRPCFVRKTDKVSIYAYLGRSRFADVYFLDVGAVLADGPKVSGLLADWHVQTRVESRSPQVASFRKALDESSVMRDRKRRKLLHELVEFAEERFFTPWGDEKKLIALGIEDLTSEPTQIGFSAKFKQYVAGLAHAKDQSPLG